ncbi:MAG TPA: M56 family metallopeptidase [Longimicrobium sp.]
MIAYWMLYCAAVGVLLGLGAMALERALRPIGRATRWVWAAALLLTLAVPAATRFLPQMRPATPAPSSGAWQATVSATTESLPRKRQQPWLDAARLDAPLAVVWGASSAGVALALAGMAGVLERRRRRWPRTEVDGVPVLVSGDTGPAVVGLLRSRIVLPRWAVDADPEARRLVLEHEQEHVRAGDPRLLALGLLAAALMPWNPAVWWQLRRLRLAVEVDCDARVLRRRRDVLAYGAVLLEVGRRTVHSRLAAAAFAEPVSSLERRIRIMTAPRVRRPFLSAAAFGAIAAALVFAACETPAPTQPSAGTSRALYRAPGEEMSFVRTPLTPQTAVATFFPQVMQHGMGANELLLFVISSDGGVLRHEQLAGSDDRQTLAAATADIPVSTIRSVDVMKRPAGELGPSRVNIVWVQLKTAGDDRSTMTMSRQVPSGTDREGSWNAVRTRAPGVSVVTGVEGVASPAGAPDAASLRAAMQRFYTPQMAAAGLVGQAEISYVVGADGRARDVEVYAKPATLEPAARSIVAALTFGPEAANHEGAMRLDFGPEKVTDARTPAP